MIISQSLLIIIILISLLVLLVGEANYGWAAVER
jgi:hypothetical protein